MGFEVVTMVPFEPHLIVPEMMTFKQVKKKCAKGIRIKVVYLIVSSVLLVTLVEPLSRHSANQSWRRAETPESHGITLHYSVRLFFLFDTRRDLSFP